MSTPPQTAAPARAGVGPAPRRAGNRHGDAWRRIS